jgi:hypothetical protein
MSARSEPGAGPGAPAAACPDPAKRGRAVSEREGSQRERGATTAVRPEGRGPDSREERA